MERLKKPSILLLALTIVLASCSSQTEDFSGPERQTVAGEQRVTDPMAVGFDAYTQRDITRAGYAGVLNDAQLQKSKEEGGGFGVFGYYTDQQDYDLQISKPNFMYNQGVFYTGSKWDYTPIKYWPNEYGSDAESQDIDKVTFYAYAPYVEVNPTTGKVTGDDATGITAVSRNTNTGDPIVWYKGSFKPSEAVDLCWGVVGSEADADWTIIQDKAIQKMEVGFPWVNVQRLEGTSDQKMKFTFKHALAQLNIQIDADPDLTAHDESTDIATDTKVYVRSITFSGLASKGSLNLNNIVANEPLWQSYYGSGSIYSETATIFDGRRDGKEGVSGAVAVNETLTGLNPAIISDDGNTTTGVTKELKNLFDAAALTDAIYTIPTGEPITVSIVYDVETADRYLTGVVSDGVTNGISIENKITKEVVFGEDEYLKAGKKYTLILHLGLNSVKFDAAVSEWTDNSAAADSWLPGNGDSSGSGTTPTTPTKPQAAIATAPTAVTGLTYSGSAQSLVTAGTSDEGTVQYAIGNASGPTGAFSTTVPTATNAGTYYIWYKVVGDADHSDSAPQKLTVTVVKAAATLTLAAGDLAFAATDLVNATLTKAITASEGAQTVTAVSGDGTKCTVSVSGTTITVTRKSTDAFSDVVITVTLTGDANHNNATATFKVSAEKCDTNMSAGSSINNWTTASENITVTEKP